MNTCETTGSTGSLKGPQREATFFDITEKLVDIRNHARAQQEHLGDYDDVVNGGNKLRAGVVAEDASDKISKVCFLPDAVKLLAEIKEIMDSTDHTISRLKRAAGTGS